MRQLPHLIDIHSHAIFNFGSAAPLAKQPAWSVDGALELMDRAGIQTSIISVAHAANESEGQEASDIARRVNEAIAGIVAKHPKRFGGMVCVPGRDCDRALEEMAYGLDVLKLDAMSTSTNINDRYLGDAFYDPWFEEMNRREVTLFIHPSTLTTARQMSLGLNFSVFEFMFDTTRMLANMVITGAKKRFSAIRMIATHAGGTMPFLLQRMQVLESHFGIDGRETIPADEVRELLASFYYDLTASTTHTQLTGLLEFVPKTQLLMGVDIPFMPGWTVGAAIADVARYPVFSDEDLALIANGNAARLFPRMAARSGLL